MLLFLFVVGCKEQMASQGQSPSRNRYQLVSANNAGMVFKIDTFTGHTWRITASGEESLVCPPGPMLSLQDVKDMHATLFEGGVTKLGLRDWAIELHRKTDSSLYDAALMQPAP